VSYLLLPWILEQESKSDFKRIHQHWRPTSLLMVRQTRILLKDMRSRLERIQEATDELQTLPKADRYFRRIVNLRVHMRDAGYMWRADQVAFLEAVSGFYSEYGVILRFLKFDQAMGRFTDKPKGA